MNCDDKLKLKWKWKCLFVCVLRIVNVKLDLFWKCVANSFQLSNKNREGGYKAAIMRWCLENPSPSRDIVQWEAFVVCCCVVLVQPGVLRYPHCSCKNGNDGFVVLSVCSYSELLSEKAFLNYCQVVLVPIRKLPAHDLHSGRKHA